MGEPRHVEGMAKTLLEKLCIVAYPPTPALLRELGKLEPEPKCIELRLDPVLKRERPSIQAWIPSLIRDLSASGRRIILTLREESEGGSYNGDPRWKMEVLTLLASYGAWLVDLEWSYPLLGEAVDRLRAGGVNVLVSTHIRDRTLTLPGILGLVYDIRRGAGGVLVKIVHKCNGIVSEGACLAGVSSMRGVLSCFSAWGPCSLARVLGPLVGAPLSYAGFGRRVVPGQLLYGEIIGLWRGMGLL